MGVTVCQYLEYWHTITYIDAMNILGLVLSFVLVGVVVGAGVLLSRSRRFSPELIRKFIHIGVSNWWFLLIGTIDTLTYALVGPILFTLVNAVVVFTGMSNLLGIRERVRNLGLIYFPISLLLLVLAGYSGTMPLWACGMGFMTMGYGDGLAALIGQRYGKRKFVGGKTLVGTITMLLATMLVITSFSIGYRLDTLWRAGWWTALVIISVSAGLLEAYTPFGLDNLSVPLGTAILSFFLLGGL